MQHVSTGSLHAGLLASLERAQASVNVRTHTSYQNAHQGMPKPTVAVGETIWAIVVFWSEVIDLVHLRLLNMDHRPDEQPHR